MPFGLRCVGVLTLVATFLILTTPASWALAQEPTPGKKPDEDLRRELLRMTKEDQDARAAVLAWLKQAGNADTGAAKQTKSPQMEKLAEIDRKNTQRMKEIVAKHGWPGKRLVGADGAHAAWLLVQHADHDRAFQKQCLGLMKDLVARGDVTGADLAYLTDRVLVGEQKKQLYGTQCTMVTGEVVFQPIEDEANVDKRRAEIGLSPLAEYKRLVEKMYRPTPPDK